MSKSDANSLIGRPGMMVYVYVQYNVKIVSPRNKKIEFFRPDLNKLINFINKNLIILFYINMYVKSKTRMPQYIRFIITWNQNFLLTNSWN